MRAATRMNRALVTLVIACLFLAPSITLGEGERVPRARTYPSTDAIRAWAEKAFFGGYDAQAFSRHGKEVFVIVGMPTSGLPSSEIVVFQRREDGSYGVMLTRTMMYGIVTVRADEQGIVFSAKDPILVIPWAGVVVGSEQVER